MKLKWFLGSLKNEKIFYKLLSDNEIIKENSLFC